MSTTQHCSEPITLSVHMTDVSFLLLDSIYLISIWQNRFSPWFTDNNFSVKCGGPQTISSNQIIYERDNETLGPATYYVTSTKRWAVSNVGRFGDNNNSKYTSNSSSQFFAKTSDAELFQTARISPASLRYYGLGLVNGNYTVSLQFAEITILNPNGWESLGRRVFDIYIQVCAQLWNWILKVMFLFSVRPPTMKLLDNICSKQPPTIPLPIWIPTATDPRQPKLS